MILSYQETRDAYRETQQERAAFAKIRNAEYYYSAQLRKIAMHIDALVKGMMPATPAMLDELQRILERYGDILRPWARSTAARMLADVQRRDGNAWVRYGNLMGMSLRREITETPFGDRLQQLMDSQVDLITSLPRDAALRVHQIVTGNLYSGARPDQLVQHILQTGEVTKARAMLIARTETGRVASSVTQIRAEYIGSPGYIWRSANDYLVRPEIGTPNFAKLNTLAMGSHRKLNGTYQLWSAPPIAGTRGERAHAGAIYNCRCWPEPILPGDEPSKYAPAWAKEWLSTNAA
jgi:hypothetical protein